MGLTSASTGAKLLDSDLLEIQKNCDYTIALARQPQCWKKYNF